VHQVRERTPSAEEAIECAVRPNNFGRIDGGSGDEGELPGRR
jgi:hypothetical protein